MASINKAKNALASSDEDFNDLTIEELILKANAVGIPTNDSRKDIINDLNAMRTKIRDIRQKNVQIVTTLLKNNVSDTPRETFIYYKKEEEIPHVGDIVYVSSFSDSLLGIVVKVNLGKKKDSFYKIARLQQKGFSKGSMAPASLSSRSDLYVPDDVGFVNINPKDRSVWISWEIIKRLGPWEEELVLEPEPIVEPEIKQKIYVLRFASDGEIIGLFSGKKKIKAHIKKNYNDPPYSKKFFIIESYDVDDQ